MEREMEEEEADDIWKVRSGKALGYGGQNQEE
jgi:hypothetical protein